MNSNSINLFKYRYWDGTYVKDTDNGSARWGNYVEKLQDLTFGDDLTYKLTDYNYIDYYLNEVYRGR